MGGNGYEQWKDGTMYNPHADQQELFEAVINELGRLGNAVHFRTNERRGRSRTAYLTRVLGEVQALRVVIEDGGVTDDERNAQTGCEDNACVPGYTQRVKPVAEPAKVEQPTLPMEVETTWRYE